MANQREQRSEKASLQGNSQEPNPEERKTSVRPQEPRPAVETPDGLNQLREILVGATVRDLERRVARAEAHMAARAHELEQESRRRMEVIEAHLRKESDALTARLEREVTKTGEAIRAAAREHRDSIAAVDQRAAKLEETIARAQRELRDELLQQAKTFLDELQQLRREVTEALESEFVASEAFEPSGHGKQEERLTL